MHCTHTCDFDELVSFAQKHFQESESDARMKVEDYFFPECDRLVVFKREDYDDVEEDSLEQMIAVFLDTYKIPECFVTGPEY